MWLHWIFFFCSSSPTIRHKKWFLCIHIYTARRMNEKYTVNVDWDKFKNCQCEWTVIFYLKNSAEWEFFCCPCIVQKKTRQTMFFLLLLSIMMWCLFTIDEKIQKLKRFYDVRWSMLCCCWWWWYWCFTVISYPCFFHLCM